jgi:hypothetical protein
VLGIGGAKDTYYAGSTQRPPRDVAKEQRLLLSRNASEDLVSYLAELLDGKSSCGKVDIDCV